MTEQASCKKCGTPVCRDTPFGYCAKCLLEFGLAPAPAEAPTFQADTTEKAQAHSDYDLLKLIGRGGMGLVYKARQISLNRTVALKIVQPAESISAMVLERFQVEARAAAHLDHPNIVPIYEVGEHEGQPCISMKLIDGLGLNRLITPSGFHFPSQAEGPATGSARNGQLVLAQIMAKVARAVHHAHQRGILHRDLKPSNILLTPQGEPFLMDFGLAKILGQEQSPTLSSVVMGTPPYMAPEQAAGDAKRVSAAADIYGLGAILYELLTGRPPFCGATPVETLRKVIEEEPKPPTTLNVHADRELGAIALKCLDKHPKRRYATAENLAEDLERWLRNEPILARSAGPWLRCRRWFQRKLTPRVSLRCRAIIGAGTVFLIYLALQLSRYGNTTAPDEKTIQENKQEILEERLNKLWAGKRPYIQIGSRSRQECWPPKSQRPDAKREGPQLTSREREVLQLIAEGFPGTPLRLIVGVYAHEKPVESLTNFIPLLDYLEERLSLAYTNPVHCELRIYRANDTARKDLTEGKVDFLRVGAGPYVEAKEENPGITPLVWQQPYPAVVFTRSDTGINALSDLTNRSIAFGHPDSTVSGTHGKALLAEHGLRQAQLKPSTNFNNHLEVLKAVTQGRYDAGLAKKSLYNKFVKEEKASLKLLAEFPCTGMPWVAKSGLSPRLGANFKKALLALPRDDAVLRALPDNTSVFTVTTDQDFNQVRKEKKNAKMFLE